MKIDTNAINPGAVSLGSTERIEAEKRAGQGAGAKGSASDAVQLSSDAQLLHSALRAAQDVPATRSDKVDEVRQKLVLGDLGTDALRLADRLIDDILER